MIDLIKTEPSTKCGLDESTMLDTVDRRLLATLDRDPRAPVALLAQVLGIARGTVHSRITKLTSKSLRPHSTRIRPSTLGLPLRALMTATIRQAGLHGTMASITRIPFVLECLAVTGTDDVFCQIVARDTEHLYEITEALLSIPGVERTSTSVVLKEHIEYRTHQLLSRPPTDS